MPSSPTGVAWRCRWRPTSAATGSASSARCDQPLRFREAISALHDVVISDLRYQPRDKTAYQAYLAEQKQREDAIRKSAVGAAKQQLLARLPEPIPEGLEQRFRDLRRVYWNARQQYSNYLAQHDPELWRLLMPCDPVITVAPDVLFFECFSADESSYGCLTVDRDAFAAEHDVALGTTNVDYSWALYEHFQNLRSYRETRFLIDPAGFEVQHGRRTPITARRRSTCPQAGCAASCSCKPAMSLPMRRVPVEPRGAVQRARLAQAASCQPAARERCASSWSPASR